MWPFESKKHEKNKRKIILGICIGISGLTLIGGGIGIGYALKKNKDTFTAHVSHSLLKHQTSNEYIVINSSKKVIGKKCTVSMVEDTFPTGLSFGNTVEQDSDSLSIIRIIGIPGLEGDFHASIKIEGFKSSVQTLLTITKSFAPVIVGQQNGLLQMNIIADHRQTIKFDGHNISISRKKVTLVDATGLPTWLTDIFNTGVGVQTNSNGEIEFKNSAGQYATPTAQFGKNVEFSIAGETCNVYIVVAPQVLPNNYVYAALVGYFYTNQYVYTQKIHFYSLVDLNGKYVNLNSLVHTLTGKDNDASTLAQIDDKQETIVGSGMTHNGDVSWKPIVVGTFFNIQIIIFNSTNPNDIFYTIGDFEFSVYEYLNEYFYISDDMAFDKGGSLSFDSNKWIIRIGTGVSDFIIYDVYDNPYKSSSDIISFNGCQGNLKIKSVGDQNCSGQGYYPGHVAEYNFIAQLSYASTDKLIKLNYSSGNVDDWIALFNKINTYNYAIDFNPTSGDREALIDVGEDRGLINVDILPQQHRIQNA